MSSMARLVSLAVLTALIVFLGITFFQFVAPFLLPLFLAGVLSVLCQPGYRYFVRRTKGRPRVAAGLTTCAVLATILIPLLVVTFIASVQLFTLAHDTLGGRGWRDSVAVLRRQLEIDRLVDRLLPYVATAEGPESVSAEPVPAEADETKTRGDLPDDESNPAPSAAVSELQHGLETNLRAALKEISQRTLGFAGAAAGAVPGAAINILGAVVSVLLGCLMFVIALYYFLADGPALLKATENLIPVHVGYQRELLKRFDQVVRAVAVATFLASIAQGVMTALALALAGFGHFFLFFIVATLASLIPLAGAWLVWGPCAIWLFAHGFWISGSLLVVFGAVVIGMADNVIRTYVLHSDAKLHPLLAFVSVLGGLRVMGLWGVFIGPIVASCLHALVQIFNTELKEFTKQRFPGSDQPEVDDGQSEDDHRRVVSDEGGDGEDGGTTERLSSPQQAEPAEALPSHNRKKKSSARRRKKVVAKPKKSAAAPSKRKTKPKRKRKRSKRK